MMDAANADCTAYRADKGRYVPGGRNVMAGRYETEGFPAFADRPRWIGELTGSWYGMGRALGRACGDMVAASTDYWWGRMCRDKGRDATLRATDRYRRQVEMLDPTQLDLLQGIADGAARELAGARCGDPLDPCHADPFSRVFATSIFDSWLWGDPDAYGVADAANDTAEGYINGDGCNSVAVKGRAAAGGVTLSSQLRHTQQAGLCHQASVVYAGEGCHAVWSVGNVPTPNGLMLVNDRGVSISHHFGGSTTQASLACDGGPCFGSAYGVPWPNLLFYAAKTAGTAEEALDVLKHGSPRYRSLTGRDTVLRDGAWNWMVCDRDTLAVMEASPDRYAVRYAGEHTGADWTDPDYIVCANHFLCPFSYDEHDRRTDVPMTVFNNSSNSEARFWTLMWELRDFYGTVDEYTLQYVFSQTYLRDRETGEHIYALAGEDGRLLTAGQVLGCVQGRLQDDGRRVGTNGAKIARLDGADSACWFCLGNPKDWQGAWDLYRFSGGDAR